MNLKEIRLHFSDLSQEEVAAKLGIKASGVSITENRELDKNKLGTIKQYASILGVTVETIINHKKS